MAPIDDSDEALLELACTDAVRAINSELENSRILRRQVDARKLLATALSQLGTTIWTYKDLQDCIAYLKQQQPQEAA